jgi:hypothetical protein
MEPLYIVQVFAEGEWRRLKGPIGQPFRRRRHAEQLAAARAASRRTSITSTEGCPHRVVELGAAQ